MLVQCCGRGGGWTDVVAATARKCKRTQPSRGVLRMPVACACLASWAAPSFCSDGAVLRTHAFPAAAWACIACKEVYPCCLCGGACVLRAVSVTTRDRCFSELCVFSPLEDAASLWASQRTPRSQSAVCCVCVCVARGGAVWSWMSFVCVRVLFFFCLKLDPIPNTPTYFLANWA